MDTQTGQVWFGFWKNAASQRLKDDTSPPIWELRSTRERRNVYERELVLDEHFCFAMEFPRVTGVYVCKRKSTAECPWRKHVDPQALLKN